MNLKSITFRCSSLQNARLNFFLNKNESTRTAFIIEALESFLNFAEQEPIREMNLFELVEAVDSLAEGPGFSEQA